MSPVTQMVPADHIYQRGIVRPFDVLKEVSVKPIAGQVMLPPYAALWLVNRD